MTEDATKEKSKVYNRTKQRLTLIHLAYTIVVLLIPILTPLSIQFKVWAMSFVSNPYAVVALYFLFYTLYSLLMDFPFSYYAGYVLEHRFNLSNQNFFQWIGDFLKKSGLSFAFSVLLVMGLYAIIWRYPDRWWLIAWACFAVVSYVMGKLFPVVIVPLFYKYGQVEDESLKTRILTLADRYGMPVENLYSLNLSKTTKKANAAFMGLGKTKRVVLSDTLIDNFTHDEIETVVAHELGHFKHRDIWKQLTIGFCSSFLGFWIVFQIMQSNIARFGFEGIGDVAGLPLLFFIFYIFSLVLMPLQNGLSRRMERAADEFALTAYPHTETFISCMDKLGKVNLADSEPHPLYEWFFYDHPAIGRRIQMAKEWKGV